jgi:hypothetical protein
MVESAFGLKKFVDCVNSNLDSTVINTLQLAINVETIQAYKAMDDILAEPNSSALYGITIGRVDFVSSMGKDRSYVNSPEMLEMVKDAFTKVKKAGLTANLGGAITTDSYKFLSELYKAGLLDKFETRYAIYDPSKALKNLGKALAKGQLFEYEWLMNKRESYQKQADKEIHNLKAELSLQQGDLLIKSCNAESKYAGAVCWPCSSYDRRSPTSRTDGMGASPRRRWPWPWPHPWNFEWLRLGGF